MTTITQCQKGFTKFVDNHVAGSFDGWQKAVVLGGSALIAKSFPNLLAGYANNAIVNATGVIDSANGTVDIDLLYSAFVPNMGTDKIPIAIPKIGTIKLGKEEIDILFRYIKEA